MQHLAEIQWANIRGYIQGPESVKSILDDNELMKDAFYRNVHPDMNGRHDWEVEAMVTIRDIGPRTPPSCY